MIRTTPLRDLVTRRLDMRWVEFSREHPNLAAAIDRVDLVEQAVDHLRQDAGFIAAMDAAGLDETRLTQAAAVLERIEQAVTLLLPR